MNHPQEQSSAMNDKEIEALISLIDDPDEKIFEQVRDQVVSLGESVIPKLESFWEKESFGQLFQNRIEDIIHEIQFSSVQHSLKTWKEEGGKDLLTGALILMRYQYPDLDEKIVRESIAQIRQDIWIELNDNLTSFEQVKIFNHILFEVYGFRGNKKNYHAPQNSYLNHLIESKKGNPLTLSMLYIILAESLEIPIFGVNLPNHFILAYLDRFNIMSMITSGGKMPEEGSILFYINPFSLGTILNRDEITTFLTHLKIEPQESHYQICDNVTILLRNIYNLIHSYEKLGYTDKMEELKTLANILH
jgi:hypothetical protein